MHYPVSQAKSVIKSCLWDLVNPHPRNLEKLIEHFGGRCAYCETPLHELSRHSRKDLLVALDRTTKNSLGNFVLVCDTCFDYRQRTSGWLEYLTEEFGEHARFENRKRRIEIWIAKHAEESGSLEPEKIELVENAIKQVFNTLDVAVAKLQDQQI